MLGKEGGGVGAELLRYCHGYVQLHLPLKKSQLGTWHEMITSFAAPP